MKRKRRIRLSYANVVASLALFAALGGSSYAAISITGKQVRDGSLGGRDVRDRSLTGKDVRDRSLLAQDFKQGQLPAGPQGPKGDPGAPGTAGPKGDPGSPGLSDVELVQEQSATDATSPKGLFVYCPDGKHAIAAGGHVGTQAADRGKVILTVAHVNGSNQGWVVADKVAGANPGAWTLHGYVTCARVQ